MEDAERIARAAGSLRLDAADEARLYALFHAPRYDTVVELLQGRVEPGSRVADFGPSQLTMRLRNELPAATVDTFGLEPPGELGGGAHIHIDLGALRHDDALLEDRAESYAVVVFAEVLEHLYVSPRRVLAFLRNLLVPGGLLVLQTPNAADLAKRIKLLLGRNPYELLNEDRGNPGHVREYTARELRAYLADAGLGLVELRRSAYFDHRYVHHSPGMPPPGRLAVSRNYFERRLPEPLRPGITLLAQREHADRSPQR